MLKAKHYIITSITLGSIALASALLIGLTNMITKERIIQNEINKVNSGIASIFGDNSKISEDKDIEGHNYVNHVYTVDNSEDTRLGYGFRVTGSNMYGKISLLVGFDESSHNFMGMYIVTDEQTYAQTLEDNYIGPVNAGTRDIDDVKCGATYGATLIRDMIADASEAAKEMWKE